MEEVGTKLVVEGQAQFISAMQKAAAAGTAFGMAIYNAAISVGKAMVDFSASSIKAASDLNETFTKSQVVFGKYGFLVADWAKTSATAFGMSTNSALGAASSYGNLFRSMGIGEKASFDMSTGLVQLAADLASFNNMDPTEVLDKLRSGLSGETEPLKSLGVNLNQAGIEAEAMRLKLWNGKGTLDAAAKAQASYSLILKQTSLAQGDFARTSDGLANQQRIFAANLENTKAALGTALLPVINLVMNALNKLFNSPEFQAGMQSFITGIANVVAWITDNWPTISATFMQVYNTISGIITGIVGFFQQNMPVISAAFQQVSDTVTGIMAWIQGVILSALTIIQGWWAENGTAIMASVTTMWEGVKGMFQAAATFIQTLISFVLVNIQAFWQAHGDQVMAIVNWLWTTIQTVFNTAVSIITSVFNAFTQLLQGNWQGFVDNLVTAWNTLWSLLRSAAEGAWAILSAWFQGIIESILGFFSKTDWGAIGKGIIDGIWGSLKSGWSKLTGLVSDLASNLWKAAKQALGINSPSTLFEDIGVNMMLGMGQGIEKGTSVPVRATMQAAAAVSAGPNIYTYNHSNNYNLNLTTMQTSQSVQQSFAIMQMLAG